MCSENMKKKFKEEGDGKLERLPSKLEQIPSYSSET